MLVVALCSDPVGVDIEIPRLRKNSAALAARFFCARDFQRIQLAPAAVRDALFLRQWVAKEAALKAAGCGLSAALKLAECAFAGDAIYRVAWADGHAAVHPFTLADGTPGAFAWLSEHTASIHWHTADELKI